MIQIFKGELFDTKAGIIINLCNCQGVMESEFGRQITERYPHVEIEYRKYLRYCKKNKLDPLGTVQYVPDEVWAAGLVDTMKNNRLEPCEDFQYIANILAQTDSGAAIQTNLNALETAFKGVLDKAKTINASVAIPFGTDGFDNDFVWSDIYNIIKKVFINSGVDVEIWKSASI